MSDSPISRPSPEQLDRIYAAALIEAAALRRAAIDAALDWLLASPGRMRRRLFSGFLHSARMKAGRGRAADGV
ncbi:MAG TPA: hypothetical protein PLN02_04685 [Azonexus sp.]|jgi:hypothetical protein|nr:hypothetical protein [Azonexus sp.]